MTFFAHLNNEKKIIFNDGVLLSIQAGPYYYSQPREDLAFNKEISCKKQSTLSKTENA